MKLCLFDDRRLGVVVGDDVLDVSDALSVLPPAHYPYPRHDALIANLAIVRPAIERALPTARRVPIASVGLASPVANPGKLVAAPVNYQAHLDEAIADTDTFSRAHVRKIQETGLFLKATSSLIGAGTPIPLALPDRRTDHEIELVAIIGTRAKAVGRGDALGHVAGYAIGLDITIRGPEERSLRKSLDGYSVLGPWLVTADELGDPHALDLVLDIDGDVRQRANTRDLILDVADLIVFASRFYTLEPGDLLFTGTPEGVGPIAPGETINAAISGIGTMTVQVA